MARTILLARGSSGPRVACAVCSAPPVESFAGFDFCEFHVVRIRAIAAAAGITPTASSPMTTTASNTCACGTRLRREPGSDDRPEQCAKCRAKSNGHANRKAQRTKARARLAELRETADDGEAASESEAASETEASVDAERVLDLIDEFGLDFNLGSVMRYVLEREDGDPHANLQTARVYLDRAIARLEAA